jgi:hypothetical protein
MTILLSKSRLDDILALPGILQAKQDTECSNFLGVEVKKDLLERHEAQTIGENIVM